MFALTCCLLQIVITISGLTTPDQDDPDIICQYKYDELFYSELPLDLLTASTALSIYRYRDTLLDQRYIPTLLGDFFPLELSSLRFDLNRYSNQSAVLFISCQSMDPASEPNSYYSAFVIYKPLTAVDSRPHWFWIRRVNLTDTTDPAFPDRWKRVQLASNVNFTHVRLQVCLDSALFLDISIPDNNPFGCRSTDTRGVPRETDQTRLELNCRHMIQALEEAEQVKTRELNGIGWATPIYSLLGLASCAAIVWLIVRQGRPSRKKSVAKMSGGFFFEHIVEFLLPKSDAQKVAEAEAKQKKSSDQKVQLKK
ncbi:hypothetical protein quinque_000537 [Culex quinquefasciatus]